MSHMNSKAVGARRVLHKKLPPQGPGPLGTSRQGPKALAVAADRAMKINKTMSDRTTGAAGD